MAAIFGRFSGATEQLLIAAQKLARTLDRPMGSDLLVGLIASTRSPAGELLRVGGLTSDQVQQTLVASIEPFGSLPAQGDMQALLEQAIRAAARFKFSNVEVEHLLLVICTDPRLAGHQLLRLLEQDTEQIANRLREWLMSVSMMSQGERQGVDDSRAVGGGEIEIERYLTDLTQLAERGQLDPVVGREKELEEMIQILLRRQKNNPLLIGEPGVGKTALVDLLAQRIARRIVPAALAHKKVYSLDLSLVVAGTMYRGQFEERLKAIVQQLQEQGNAIVFIDEVHTLTGTGSAEGGFDAANILKPALARGELTIIGATTHEEYRSSIRPDKALDRRFQSVEIKEPDQPTAVQMLASVVPGLERHHHVMITEEAVQAAVSLSSRYLHGRYLPDKAIDVLDQASTLHAEAYKENPRLKQLQEELSSISAQKSEIVEQASTADDWELAKALSERETGLLKQLRTLQRSQRRSVPKPVTEHQVARVIASRTGIPLSQIQGTLDAKRVQQIRRTLAEQLLGQREATDQIANALLRSQLGLQAPHKPMASFLLVGPTGVGKTETARLLAKEVFGSESALIKLDMSEFMERHTSSTLTGAPPGYVGFEQGGSLTEQVRRRPYAVVLFDEVEKAHPDVFNLLLSVLEDGYLTDASGERTSFAHTIILLTSNIGMGSFNKVARIGFAGSEPTDLQERESLRGHIERELKDFFRPELLGRLSNVLHYQPLSPETVTALAKRQLATLAARLNEKGITLNADASVQAWISAAYQPEAGARSIERVVAQQLEPLIIEAMIANPSATALKLAAANGTPVIEASHDTD